MKHVTVKVQSIQGCACCAKSKIILFASKLVHYKTFGCRDKTVTVCQQDLSFVHTEIVLCYSTDRDIRSYEAFITLVNNQQPCRKTALAGVSLQA